MHSSPGVGISTAALEKDLSAQHAASVEPGLTGPPTPPDPSHPYQSSTTEARSHRESQGVGRAPCSCSPLGALLNALDWPAQTEEPSRDPQQCWDPVLPSFTRGLQEGGGCHGNTTVEPGRLFLEVELF